MNTKNIHQDKILILDFGSQYTQLIARRVREAGVYCEIYHHQVSQAKIIDFKPKGIILSGGPESVTQKEAPVIPKIIFDMALPILGICYGMQALAHQLGGIVEASNNQREFGHAALTIPALAPRNALFNAICDHTDELGQGVLDVWMSHGDKVTELPPGFAVLAQSHHAPISAMGNLEKNWYGVQFHPEVTHTRQGMLLLKQFLVTICGCDQSWTTDNIMNDIIAAVQQKVGNQKVLLGLSGGVDSSVVAALLQKAIGANLYCVFVDTGLLRLNEVEQVQSMFAQHLGMNLITVHAKDRYFDALKNITDPEAKRKIIGKLFIDIFEEASKKISADKEISFLAQGTIYPDVIESAGGGNTASHTIKSHHNVGGLPDDLSFKLVEPIRELFKDEVRQLGLNLGLPYDMVYRHPFPGPGLGVRILGEVTIDAAETLRKADAIFIELLHKYDYYQKVSQAFAVFLPVKSVGVMGDGRVYAPVIALRAVETIDFMTARWARLPYELLEEASLRIVNELQNVSRVVYDISGKPPATIEWE
jgi:GMP synthase (glutamine-hydrolysing)